MARYFLRFRHSDTGLTPVFTGSTFFKKASDLTLVTPPAIGEVGNGTYYFDYTPTFDIVFEVDGGASIPTEEVRYISDTISPKDTYIDEPTSQVKDDVWNDTVDRAASTKGDFVEKIPGIETNLATANTALTDIKGSGFNTATDSLKIVSDNVDAINVETDAASIANAVWDASTTGNVGGGTMGGLLDAAKTAVDAINVETDPASIADAVWDAVTTGNVGAGTMGGLVGTAASGPSLSAIAGAVWDEPAAGHVAAGSFGQSLQYEDSGLAQGGATTSVTLRAGASAINDFYKNGLIAVTSGTGTQQSRSITAYNGTTKIATVDRAWGTNPIAGDGYIVHPAAPSSSLTNAGIAGAVWDEALTSHLLPGSTGAKLSSGSGVTFYANGDTVNPTVLQVASPKHTQVKITFSEPVVMTTAANGALNLSNYTIPGLTLIAVASLTSQQVLLTTSAQVPDFLYSLSIFNIEDLSGNPIL